MGIISETIKIKVNQKTAKRFDLLGYDIPKMKDKKGKFHYKFGETISVSINDLPKSSGELIDVKCDICGKEYKLSFYNYNKKKNKETIYCKHCMPKVILAGSINPRWNSKKTEDERETERKYPEYKAFVKKVMKRDSYTCQCCKQTGAKLEVHHLDGYNWCKEKRTDISNGITLCVKCHSNFHFRYGSGNNTKEQFKEWFGDVSNYTASADNCDIELQTRKQVFCLENNKVYDNSTIASLENNDLESNVKRCCNPNLISKSSKGKHYFWLDDYKKMSDDDIKLYIENKTVKKVYCITQDKLFDSAASAARYYNIDSSGKGIMLCCKNKIHYSGMLDDGTCLQWCYYKDYIKMSTENVDIKKLYADKLLKSQKSKTSVICLNTLEIFESGADAKRKMGLTKGVCPTDVCKGNREYSGVHPKTQEKLRWMYYEDYLKQNVS